ncbi:HsdM family class I SAM-dependent methyltransferase [Bacillus thuringiensis]|uniref:HsdM family class I SAM-dependent methyltransferase n=1 Tax=Bacillus thuringiensis TaxID=1428 RepID=UPI00301AE7F7
MFNERNTENIVRKVFSKHSFDKYFSIEEQSSTNPIIQKALKNASKFGKKGGRPEFILHQNSDSNNVIIIECKADIKKHESLNRDNPVEYAVDGVLLYSAHLAKFFNVIAIAISGENEKEMKISHFIYPKGSINYRELSLKTFQSPEHYIELINYDPIIEKKRQAELLSFAKEIHNDMRDFAKLTEQEKPLLVSAALLALSDKVFKSSYSQYTTSSELAEGLIETVKRVLKNAKIPTAKINNMIQPYSFIEVHPELTKKEEKKGKINRILMNLIKKIDENVLPHVNTYQSIDLLGQFYGEFLRYTGGDKKGLGIVLTPKHITELMVDLTKVNKDSVVLDTCTGTSGFLISAMKQMIELSNEDEVKIANIKANQLIGVEQQPNMYAMAASNMILRGDGKANLYQGSCFSFTNQLQLHKATVGMINPPYSQKGEGLSELDFIEHMLDCLEPNSLGAAIVPMNCATSQNENRKRLLENHTLEAVMSMPEDLFHPVGTVTCIMIFRAKVPHNPQYETWFGYWRNDGFKKTKSEGRSDIYHKWNEIKNIWLDHYINRKEVPGMCVRQKVTENDEWCAEAYMKTDYSDLNKDDFQRELKKYAMFRLMNEGNLDG